jgi:valyl-tRNA synthetase
MSKSKGNVIDPLELIDRFGADALRFTICALTGPGRDVKLGPARVESYRSFVTKLWNAARFCEMNGVAPDPKFTPEQAGLPLTRWILDAASAAAVEATAALEAYRFDEYAAVCYRFTWNTFCDWFVEFAKPALAAPDSAEALEVRRTAAHVLGIVLRLLHPAMPFVTEELWDHFGYGPENSLIRAAWPEPFVVPGAAEARVELDWVVRLITEVRTVRAEMNVPPSQKAPLLLKGAVPEALARGHAWFEAIARLARAASLEALEGEVPHGAAQVMVNEATVVIPLAGLIDLNAERARLEKERARAAGEAEKVEKKLANPEFVARAKEEVVEENRDRLRTAQSEIARLEAALARIA